MAVVVGISTPNINYYNKTFLTQWASDNLYEIEKVNVICYINIVIIVIRHSDAISKFLVGVVGIKGSLPAVFLSKN